MNWTVSIKDENEEICVDEKTLNEKDLILCTNGFCIMDVAQITDEACFKHEENGIIDKEKLDEELDKIIEEVYNYAYDCAKRYADKKEYTIK